MAFDAVLGSRTQNSLISVAQADAVVAERYSAGDWPSTEADKQKLLTTASAYLDKFHCEGVRAWPGYQRGEWPRVRGVVPNLKVDLPVRGVDHDSPIDRTLVGGTADSGGSDTAIIDATFASDKYNYPDDFFNDGALRIGQSGDANEYLIRTVSDFASSTGTFTVAAFAATVAAGTDFQVIEPLHPSVIHAVVDLALLIKREGAGFPTSEEDLITMNDIVGRDLWRVRRRTFDVV
jgi:hypothetical protein